MLRYHVKSIGVSGYTPGSSSSAAPVPTYTGIRAEKYLPSLPIIQYGEMGKGRMKEVEESHRFGGVCIVVDSH